MGAIAWLGTAIAGIAAGTGAVVGGAEQASGAKSAADTTAAAATAAAQAQLKANEEALAFQRQQAEANFQQGQTTRQANYGQYADTQAAYNAVRAELGLPAIDVPAYTPLPDPNFTSGGPTVSSTPPPNAAPLVPTVGQAVTPPTTPAAPAPSATGNQGAAQVALLAGLQGGKSGQALVDEINTQYGLPYGSSVMYQASTDTYALPSGYAAIGPDGKWGWTPRAVNAAPAAGPMAATVPIPKPQNIPAAALPPTLSAPGAVNTGNVGYYLNLLGAA